MTKPQSPLLSLAATGTISDTLTFQKRDRGTITRRKPIPAYRYTLPQAYQRWDYQDYVAWWHTLTSAQKQTWETNARPYHMTGFAYWMKDRLTTLPDIAGRWHLDLVSNSLTPDSSKNANHGTVYGASPVTGIIDKALYFDGTDDYIRVPHHSSLQLPEWTILTCIKPSSITGSSQNLLTKGHHLSDYRNYQLRQFRGWFYATYESSDGTDSVLLKWHGALVGQWYHVAFTYKDRLSRLIINGNLEHEQAQTIDPKTTQTSDLFIGEYGGI